MKLEDDKVKKILLEGGYITEEDLKRAEEYVKFHHSSLVDYLLTKQIVNRYVLGQAIAESFKVPYVNVGSRPPTREQVLKIPEHLAKKYHVIVAGEEDETITVVTDDPLQRGLRAKIEELFRGETVVLAYALPEDIEALFVHYRKALEAKFLHIIKEKRRVAPEILDEILADALAHRASDIHCEPQGGEVLVRFRVDGVLHEVGKIPREYYENILNRIKVLAHLRTDEHASAQDGAIRHASGGTETDLRVSIIPTLDGEKVVIRLLAQYVRSFTLGDLGLSTHDEERLTRAARKPFGMILVTGPTGSGKTTTLYGLLKILNQPEVNIATIEDPVEYKIVGVNQIQVNSQTNVTFANGLRSIVRQDPNIILVGEIRDRETAEIAVNAALTGHLLLSTFHANDAATSIPRFLEMGIEPFLLASTLEVIIAQRLVRRICESCRVSIPKEHTVSEKLFPAVAHYFSGAVTLYRGKGCPVCSNTGYRGRTALFEMIPVTLELQDVILKNPTSAQIWEIARKEGARTLFEDGIEKVKLGITTVEELLRVSTPPASSGT